MPNRNYQAGRREEYACQRRWEKKGYTTTRSSGSHGPWDVVAVRAGSPVKLIQCKVTSDPAVAKILRRDFINNPPLWPSTFYHQIIEIRIKGSTKIQSSSC